MKPAKTVAAVAAGLTAAAVAGGYGLYRFSILRRKPPAAPVPGEGANEARKKYSSGYAAQMQWLRDWGWEDVSIRSADGARLAGYLFRAKQPTTRTALAVHGYRCDGGFREYLYFAPMYLEALGMNLLLVDDYAHAQSEGKRIGFGWNDRRDCVAWAKWLAQRMGPESEILLQGVSMGAATVMMAAGEADLPPQVRWVVADCGFTNVGAQIRHVMKTEFHVPPFPIYHTASLFCKLLAGYSFGEADARSQVAKAKLPMLFVHGSTDHYVPTSMAYELYAACNTSKELLIVDGAAHAESFLVDPVQYQAAVERLLKQG